MMTGDLKDNNQLNVTLDECPSTNTYLKKLGEQGAPHGSWISTKIQTDGRGRLGRKWEALDGNLYLSILIRITEDIPLTWIPLMSAVSVVETILALSPSAQLKIKWPNDLVVMEDQKVKKAGGILCEGVGQKGSSFVVIGIGLNCISHPEVDQPTTSLNLDANLVRPLLIERILERYRNGKINLENARHRYMKFSVIQPEDHLDWRDSLGNDASGVFKNLGPLGELRVEVNDEMKSLYSEEIKLKPIRPKGV